MGRNTMTMYSNAVSGHSGCQSPETRSNFHTCGRRRRHGSGGLIKRIARCLDGTRIFYIELVCWVQVLESLNIVSRPPSSRGSQRTPAHHSAPYACDLELDGKLRSSTSQSRSRANMRSSSRPSTAASTATGISSQRCDTSCSQLSSRTAGLGSDHLVLKKMADLEAKVQEERRARLDMEDEVTKLRSQLESAGEAA